MDTRPASDTAVIAKLPVARSASGSDDLRRSALALTKSHAFEIGPDGRMDFADPSAFESCIFARPNSVTGRRADFEAHLSDTDRRARRRAHAGLSWVGARASLDYAFTDAQGGTRHFRETLEARVVEDGRATRIVGVLTDRTPDVETDARTVWAARHDAVTGLENDTAFTDRAEMIAALGTRVQLPAHILRLRVANLQTLGATYGPECADRLMVRFARRLSDAVRQPDALARLADGDFAVALLGADTQTVTERLQTLAAETPYETQFGPLYLDVTIASARLSPLPGGTDEALVATRRELDGTGSDLAPARPRGRMDVIAALEDDRISLAFQPIVHARTGAVHHHECLLRLRCEDGRVISAGAIVQDAERLGLISQLDERALDLAAPHLAQHPDVHLALNVSAGTIGNDAAAARYLDKLAALGRSAFRVTIEMTETLAVDDPATAARFSSDVRGLGCRFAIDDFGSGYTTFRNLMAVEADSLKIDGSLIRGIATDPNKQTFMRMMIDLAQTFSVKTVAEMVETEADAAVLRRLGTDYLQGYHFGHPAPAPVWSRLAG